VGTPDRVQLAERGGDELAEGDVVLAHPTFGDLVDGRLGPVDGVIDIAVVGVAELHDPGTRLHEPAQYRLLGHDARVVARVGRGGHPAHEGMQVGRAADPLQLLAAGKQVGHGDRVGRLAPAVEVEDGIENQLVGGPVEVRAAQDLHHVGDGLVGQQHPAEDALLGGDVLGGGPLERRHVAGQRGVGGHEQLTPSRCTAQRVGTGVPGRSDIARTTPPLSELSPPAPDRARSEG